VPAILHGKARKILPDGKPRNEQFIKIGAPVKIHQDAKGLVGLSGRRRKRCKDQRDELTEPFFIKNFDTLITFIHYSHCV
jgi:hypothetical protein